MSIKALPSPAYINVMGRPDKPTSDIACEIGQYYLKLTKGDRAKAREMIKSLGIKEIALLATEKGHVVHIKLTYPGRLIGRRGSNMADLEKHLGKPIRIYEVDDINDHILLAPDDDPDEKPLDGINALIEEVDNRKALIEELRMLREGISEDISPKHLLDLDRILEKL